MSRAQGLEIMAFPCNNFGSQEPGSNAEILTFAKGKGVTFPVFGKLECEHHKKTSKYCSRCCCCCCCGYSTNSSIYVCCIFKHTRLITDSTPEAMLG